MKNKFARIVYRLMTDEEVRMLCHEMDLEFKVTEFVTDCFEDMKSAMENDDDDSFREEDVADEKGRLCFGETWESQYDQLADVMGIDLDDPSLKVENVVDSVDRVWHAFFSELTENIMTKPKARVTRTGRGGNFVMGRVNLENPFVRSGRTYDTAHVFINPSFAKITLRGSYSVPAITMIMSHELYDASLMSTLEALLTKFQLGELDLSKFSFSEGYDSVLF